MHKPIFLLPFIFIYKVVFTILKIPFYCLKYFTIGCLYVINFILTLGIYQIKGFIWISYLIFKIIHNFIFYCFIGIKTVIFIPFNLVSYPFKNKKINIEQPKLKINNKKENIVQPKNNTIIKNDFNSKTFNKLRKLKNTEQKKLLKEEIISKKKKIVEETKKENKISRFKKKNENAYINEKVEIKGQISKTKFNEFIKKFKNIPTSIVNKFKNNNFSKHKRNEQMIKREALLINFEGDDAKKSEVKILYEYVAKNPEGKVIKGYMEAFSKVEVHSFLLSEGFEVYTIRNNKWITFFHKNSNINKTKIKTKDLIFFLTQLSTYLKAGISLVESLRILQKQFKNKSYIEIFKSIMYDLTMGENLSDALLKQNVAFPKLLINMVKTAEMTGELPEVLDDMANYYTESEQTKKQMTTALMYPSLVFVFATAVIVFIMIYVIPQFVTIYENMDASKIPAFTLAVMAVSEFLQNYFIFVAIGLVVFVFLFMYLYKNVKMFRTITQWIMMHIPVIGETIIYNEVTMFTKTFSSLLSHNVFITESMEVLNKITNNEIYKMLILDTITNLAKGDKISTAFKDHWAFPIPAYEMLVTGERTGEMPEMMKKVSTYYQSLHKDQVARIKTFIEPILTVFLTVVVGLIIMAIIIPMFSMYTTVQEY
ncbi:MAG: type II secretion system F family protein [Bacilli bacterium]